MQIDILSLFPEYFKGPFEVSILKRAIEKGIIEIRHINIRDFSKDKHKKVDEKPFGGGPGMVMTPQPICDAIRHVKKKGSRVIYFSPQGKLLKNEKCRELSKEKHLILLSGHYEGIDERIIEKEVDEEISIGDFVLTSGCLPAIVLIDAVVRFIPSVLGNDRTVEEDSFQNGLLKGPEYTRPEEFENTRVPEVLLSGNHANIEMWRLEKSLEKTREKRPDLYKVFVKKEKTSD